MDRGSSANETARMSLPESLRQTQAGSNLWNSDRIFQIITPCRPPNGAYSGGNDSRDPRSLGQPSVGSRPCERSIEALPSRKTRGLKPRCANTSNGSIAASRSTARNFSHGTHRSPTSFDRSSPPKTKCGSWLEPRLRSTVRTTPPSRSPGTARKPSCRNRSRSEPPSREEPGSPGNSAATGSSGLSARGRWGRSIWPKTRSSNGRSRSKRPTSSEDPTGEHAGAVLPRGPRGRQLAASQHLSGLRRRPDRREALYLDGLHRGASPLGLYPARQAADRAANPDRDPQAGPGPAGGARPRDRAPRPEAGQHHGRQEGRADHHGFRPGAASPARARTSA